MFDKNKFYFKATLNLLTTNYIFHFNLKMQMYENISKHPDIVKLYFEIRPLKVQKESRF